MTNPSEELSYQEAKLKAANYCAYQERTQQQVREKLLGLGVDYLETENIVADLISENFINEERFAVSFASGRFRLKKWGRLKIKMHLEHLGLSRYCVNKGLEEVDENDYIDTIRILIGQKKESIDANKIKTIYELKHKISRFLIGKGYEADLVWENLNDMIK